mmetsp:Transcript_38705/g.95706  ORF Transcript_38705/g.95706 Transcript_38705/m.95706 type:complete len:217 (+) Transcript_38705:220-870(+)
MLRALEGVQPVAIRPGPRASALKAILDRVVRRRQWLKEMHQAALVLQIGNPVLEVMRDAVVGEDHGSLPGVRLHVREHRAAHSQMEQVSVQRALDYPAVDHPPDPKEPQRRVVLAAVPDAPPTARHAAQRPAIHAPREAGVGGDLVDPAALVQQISPLNLHDKKKLKGGVALAGQVLRLKEEVLHSTRVSPTARAPNRTRKNDGSWRGSRAAPACS